MLDLPVEFPKARRSATQGTSTLFVKRDLGLVAELCDRVWIMDRGRVVEEGSVRRIARPLRVGSMSEKL